MSSNIIQVTQGNPTQIATVSFDNVLDYSTYSGILTVTALNDETVLVQKIATITADGLDFGLTAAETEGLADGVYIMVYTITNQADTVNKAIQNTLIVEAVASPVTGSVLTVTDVINYAKASPVANLAANSDNDKLIGFINLGLTAIYKKFVILTKEYIVPLKSLQTIYYLPYDCMVIQSIWDELGNELDLNDEENELSILTPSFNSIQVPTPQDNVKLAVVYTANHPLVKTINDRILLPFQLIDALIWYMGYLGHGAIDGSLEGQAGAYFMKFEQSCNEVIEKGLLPIDITPNKKFDERGFA